MRSSIPELAEVAPQEALDILVDLLKSNTVTEVAILLGLSLHELSEIMIKVDWCVYAHRKNGDL